MRYLLFDYSAISIYVQTRTMQSVEFEEGRKFVEHICCKGETEYFAETVVYYTTNGIIFSGCNFTDKRVFCIDLLSCNILSEAEKPADLLTIIQKAMRTTLKIWNKQPFSASERVNSTKSILFPFGLSDRRRIVIERSNQIERLTKRGIVQPLLAYKYNAEDPTKKEDVINVDVLRLAGEEYLTTMPFMIRLLPEALPGKERISKALKRIETSIIKERDDFIYWDYTRQYNSLTTAQKKVVDYEDITIPLRIEGPAGTGKTISMLMRAYRILNDYKQQGKPIKLIYFTHSTSTYLRCCELFSFLDKDNYFQDDKSKQRIQFTTLLDFCCTISKYRKDELIEEDASDAKNYSLLLIESIIENKKSENIINTFFTLLSTHTQEVFDKSKTPIPTLCKILQHEFGIQIKGRTNCSLDEYKNLSSIANVIPDMTEKDKELVFSLFIEYQEQLKELGNYDIDDVTIETLSVLNAPRWRRERQSLGYDYIFVDEMHLFNFNEQNIFHFLSANNSEAVPICFALDYSQAIGDRGDKSNDYIETTLRTAETQKYNTIFRNSPQIAEFCRSIAVSGTLMFESLFENPYSQSQSSFTNNEEAASSLPTLFMYKNDEDMLNALHKHVEHIIKTIQCKLSDIAIISFDESFLYDEGIERIRTAINKEVALIRNNSKQADAIVLSSPYDINGLEFCCVILLGTDEGRVPQTTGVSDIAKHFISYSAYNLLYLCSSRAKYQLLLLGTNTRGISSCLKHSLLAGFIEMKED